LDLCRQDSDGGSPQSVNDAMRFILDQYSGVFMGVKDTKFMCEETSKASKKLALSQEISSFVATRWAKKLSRWRKKLMMIFRWHELIKAGGALAVDLVKAETDLKACSAPYDLSNHDR
jgi:hypothetical protein